MLALENVRKSYDGHCVLDIPALALEAGETTALIGPSGCGKSTLMRLAIGLITPDRGRILLRGRELGETELAAVRMRVGYLIQEGGLFPHMTAGENVTLMARHLAWDRGRIHERLAQLAMLARLDEPALQRFPWELSGGQRQRVALMRALMLDPELLLLDEPLGALDPMIRYELQQQLAEIFAQLGKTVLLITHDLAEADFFARRIVLLRDGRIVQDGTLTELRDNPAEAFVSRFLRAQHMPLAAAVQGSE